MSASPSKDGDKDAGSDSDSDESLTAFFRGKPRTVFAQAKVPLVPSQNIVHDASDSDSESGAGRGGRPRKKRPAPKSSLPAWTREHKYLAASASTAARAATETEDTKAKPGDDIPLILSDNDSSPGRDSKRPCLRVSTPPPQLDPSEAARIRAMAKQFLPITQEEESDPEEMLPPSLTKGDRGDQVQIHVQMVVDPERKRKNAQAVAHWEKKRIVTLYQNDKLEMLVSVLADRLNKAPDELMLVYKGMRLFSLDRTPAQLGIVSMAEMEGYEKATWEKLERERARRFQDVLSDGDEPPLSDSTPTPSPPPEAPKDGGKLRLVIRGAEGETRLSCATSLPVSKVCDFYSQKFNLRNPKNICLNFDGEDFKGGVPMSALDLEDGDMVDIKYD